MKLVEYWGFVAIRADLHTFRRDALLFNPTEFGRVPLAVRLNQSCDEEPYFTAWYLQDIATNKVASFNRASAWPL